jgi:C4-dicarboxylate transporter DctQ subunit
MDRLRHALSRLTESVAALMMAAMFATFILQIAVRYIVGSEWFTARLGHVIDASGFGWTLEFCLVMWLWIVFWGNSFIVRDKDHVTFDVVYFWVRPNTRKWFAVIGAATIAVALLLSIGPTYEKMRILRIKSSATLPVKMLPIYSIYFLFLAVVGLRYAWRMVDAMRNGVEGEGHHHLEVADE